MDSADDVGKFFNILLVCAAEGFGKVEVIGYEFFYIV